MAAGMNAPFGRMWSLGWMIIVRLILYMVVIGFFLQYIYFGEKGQIYQPDAAVTNLLLAFFISLAVLYAGARSQRVNQLIAIVCVNDLWVLTWVTLSSGGFNSVLIPCYLPILVMATAWLPRRLTAVFPSMATLGISYIGIAHLEVALGRSEVLTGLYPPEILNSLRYTHAHAIVATMLILSVIFFVVSYLSGIISDRLFIEQQLNAEVLSSMNDGVAVVSRKGVLIYSNSEFRRLFPHAKLGHDFTTAATQLLGDDDDDLPLSLLLSSEMSDTVTINRENSNRAGPPLEIRVSGLQMRGRHELYALVFLVSDLSLRRRVEKAERNLERFSAISTMAAGLAHEIRNPLSSMRSAIQEIGASFPEGSDERSLADVVMAESDRLDGIIGRFLDFSREGHLRLSERRLGGLLADLVTMISHRPEGEGVEIDLVIENDPEILCDSDRVMEVFFNLALNAAQEMPRPGGKLEIRLGSAKKDGFSGVEILFLDNGPGVDEKEAQFLFEPFFTSKHGGTGMGLPLSRKQVTMHGGDVDVHNRPEGGACFRVWLPVTPPGRNARRGGGTKRYSVRARST